MPAVNQYEVAITLTVKTSHFVTPDEAIAAVVAKLDLKDPSLITAVTARKL